MMHWFKNIFIFLFLISTFAFVKIDENPEVKAQVPLKPNNNQAKVGFVDIYNDIFFPSCALSNCHDGSFEPNFTTLQSAYYTIVKQYAIKNTESVKYGFRVDPYNSDNSLLVKRLTNCCMNNLNDRMPLLMPPLSQGKIDSIKIWIDSGAPDAFGNFPYQ